MTRHGAILRAACGLALALGAACTGAVTSADSARGVSSDHEPPRDWESAVLFQFIDSTFRFAEPDVNTPGAYGARIEFTDGVRRRAVTGRDVFVAENGAVRTPWYRVEPGAEGHATMLHVTVGDAAGEQITAEYPLTLRPDEFYLVRFGVFTRSYGPGSSDAAVQGWRSYPAPAGARRAPGDSLWISYLTQGRDCFNCPR